MTEEQLKARRTLSRFAFGLGLLGLPFILFGIYFLIISNASLAWPSVEGSVLSSEAEMQVTNRPSTSGTTRTTSVAYYVAVQYQYEVAGNPYVASRIALGEGGRASEFYEERAEAEAAAAERFPTGSSLTVYYDPDDPTSAVLEPGSNWGTFVPLLFGLFLGGAGGVLYYGARRPPISLEE